MRVIEPEQITKMMSDLFISKDAVNMTGEHQGLWVRFRAIEKAVSEIPTVDAVKVVRCRDCKHSHTVDFTNTPANVIKRFCGKRRDAQTGSYTVQDNDYCSYGEREDGEA